MDKISARSCRCLFLRVEGSVGGVPEPEDQLQPVRPRSVYSLAR